MDAASTSLEQHERDIHAVSWPGQRAPGGTRSHPSHSDHPRTPRPAPDPPSVTSDSFTPSSPGSVSDAAAADGSVEDP